MRTIQIPSESLNYIGLLIDHGYENGEANVILRLINHGIIQTISFHQKDNLGDTEGEIEYLEKCEKIPYFINDELINMSKIKTISELYNTSEDTTITVMLKAGLYTEGYYFLRHETSAYKEDVRFRDQVNEMPHHPLFEIKEETGMELFISDDEDLEINFIH